jgi:hypothetical protein
MDVINRWLPTLANIGVIAGLLLVAYELKQTRDVAVLETMQANREQRIQYFVDLRESSYWPTIARKLRDGEELSDEEAMRWQVHISAMWALVYSEWIQQDVGLTESYSQLDASVRGALNMHGSLAFWDRSGHRIYPTEFVEYVNARRPE